jgi:hypothetical protein
MPNPLGHPPIILDTVPILILAFTLPGGHNQGGMMSGAVRSVGAGYVRFNRAEREVASLGVRMNETVNSRFSKTTLQIATVVLLLFAVAGLSTLAKTSQYFPKSHPTHYVNISNKMKVATAAVLEHAPLHPVAKVVFPQGPAPKNRDIEHISVLATPIGITVSTQHRSPPLLLG